MRWSTNLTAVVVGLRETATTTTLAATATDAVVLGGGEHASWMAQVVDSVTSLSLAVLAR